MKREILFRGKRTDNGQWVEGDLINSFESVHIANCYFKPSNDETPELTDVHPETIGQFTGLLDKNGKKIFEGDILNVGENLIGNIVFIDNNCEDYGDEIHSAFHYSINNHNKIVPLDSYFKNNCKIIGNIHDNPEIEKEKLTNAVINASKFLHTN